MELLTLFAILGGVLLVILGRTGKMYLEALGYLSLSVVFLGLSLVVSLSFAPMVVWFVYWMLFPLFKSLKDNRPYKVPARA